MKAIILAAGRGSRMKDMTKERPKCLAELNGRALLDIQVDALRDAGIAEIGIVTGYRRELLTTHGLFEFHNSRWNETNMVSSLCNAEQWLTAETCIVSYSDIFYDPSAVRALMASQADIALTYDPNWLALWQKRFDDPLIDAETFRLNPSNELEEIGNQPSSVSEVEGQYMGLLKFTPTGWASLQKIRSEMSQQECDKIHMTGMLQKILESGTLIDAVQYDGEWGEVDTAEDLAVYQKPA